jgi:hypothetical protein
LLEGALPNLSGGLWRVVLTVTEPARGGAPPLTTVYKFRFDYQSSPLTLAMSTNCQSPLTQLYSQCTIAAGLPVPPGTPT